MNKEQKIEERKEIQPLLEYLQICADCIVDGEKPDFNLTYKGLKVGMEHVSMCPSKKYNYEEGSLAIINKLKRRKAIKTYEHILARRNENIIMDVKFKHQAFWNKENHFLFVRQVVEDIEKLRNAEPENFYKGYVILNNGNVHTKYIESIQLIINDAKRPLVLSPTIQYLNKITQSDFDLCVSEKYKKIVQYKQLEKNAAIQEYWLAVTINNNEPYEYWDAPYIIPNDNGYKRIFLIQYDGIRELEV